jgi:hypothetical protein
MALEKLGNDDRVVQDRVGFQAMIFLEWITSPAMMVRASLGIFSTA